MRFSEEEKDIVRKLLAFDNKNRMGQNRCVRHERYDENKGTKTIWKRQTRIIMN